VYSTTVCVSLSPVLVRVFSQTALLPSEVQYPACSRPCRSRTLLAVAGAAMADTHHAVLVLCECFLFGSLLFSVIRVLQHNSMPVLLVVQACVSGFAAAVRSWKGARKGV